MPLSMIWTSRFFQRISKHTSLSNTKPRRYLKEERKNNFWHLKTYTLLIKCTKLYSFNHSSKPKAIKENKQAFFVFHIILIKAKEIKYYSYLSERKLQILFPIYLILFPENQSNKLWTQDWNSYTIFQFRSFLSTIFWDINSKRQFKLTHY